MKENLKGYEVAYLFRQPKIYQSYQPEKEPGQFSISKRLIGAMVISFLFILIGWFLFYSKVFAVKEIIIDGMPSQEVKAEIEELRGKNIFRLTTRKTKAFLIEKQPGIKTIQIFRGLPSTLRVRLVERKPQIVWTTQSINYLMDEEGIIFTETGDPPTGGPQVIDTKNVEVQRGKSYASRSFISFVKDLSNEFTKETGVSLVNFEIEQTTFQLTVNTDRGFKVFFDTTRSLKPQLAGLKKILETHSGDIHQYVDLRVEGRAYIK